MSADRDMKNERTCRSLPGQPRIAKVQRKWGNLWGKWQGVAMGAGVAMDKEMGPMFHAVLPEKCPQVSYGASIIL